MSSVPPLVLSTVNPDFNDLVAQLQIALANDPTWKDRLTTATGQALIEFISAVGAFAQYSIEAATDEAFPETAINNSSLYAASQFLGVRVSRKGPVSVSVQLVSSIGTIVIPPYSQLTGAGSYWFNRSALTVTSTPQTFTLYQGQVIEVTTPGLGTDFQAFVSAEDSFVVSDEDVLVQITGVSIQVLQSGLWTVPQAPGVQDLTNSDGRLVLLFGNANYGSSPQSTDTVSITYVITLGRDGANLTTQNQNVQLQNNNTVTGTFTTPPSGGGDQQNATIYKNITPALSGAFDSAVTPAQYKALPLQYPGVIDAQVFAQRDINPYALTYMNVMQVCLLTQTLFSDTDWANFTQWFYAKTMYSGRIIREDPVPIDLTLNITVYCFSYSNLANVETNVDTAVTALFKAKKGILGRDGYEYDVDGVIRASDSNIDYAEITSTPTLPLIISTLQVDAPTVVTTANGGTIPPGTYDYAISVTSTLGGSTAPANWTTVNITSSANANTLTWEPVVNAASYSIWGRQTPNQLGLLGTVNANTLTFTDTGSVVPIGTVPAESTVDIYYPKLVALNITMAYSQR